MRIAVIGAGNVGGTIGAKWETAGHEVAYGLRDAAKKSRAVSLTQALEGADAVLLAIPGGAVGAFVREHKTGLDGKLLIDATNNLRGASNNAWAEILQQIPRVQLYRAFNTNGWEVYANPTVGGEQPDLFYAGPEGEGKDIAERLIADAGFRPVWVGDMDQVDVIDGLFKLWLTLSRRRGRRIAFKLLSD